MEGGISADLHAHLPLLGCNDIGVVSLQVTFIYLIVSYHKCRRILKWSLGYFLCYYQRIRQRYYFKMIVKIY